MIDDSLLPFPVLGYDLDTPFFADVKRTGRASLRIYRPDGVMVVLGRGSDAERELHIDHILKDEVQVHRRPGGGCSVVLDDGNVVVAVALLVPGLSATKEWYERCTLWMIDGLRRIGIEGVHKQGISDLAVGDRKVGGSAVYRAKDLFHYAVTMLVTPRLELIDRYLKHPPREPEYRAGRPHLEFVASLGELAGVTDPEEFMKRLEGVLNLEKLYHEN